MQKHFFYNQDVFVNKFNVITFDGNNLDMIPDKISEGKQIVKLLLFCKYSYYCKHITLTPTEC